MISDRLSASGFSVALMCGASSISLMAWSSAATAQEGTVDFSIGAGSLGTVLNAIGRTAAAPISFSPDVVRNIRSGPISGRMTVTQAVERATAGSKVRVVVGSGGMVSVVGDTSAGKDATNGGVTTDIADIEVSGNGSRTSDPIATEGAGTYSARGANVATKANVSIKDTPKSVSVVSDQQVKDQHLTTLDDAVAALPGLNATPPGGSAVNGGASIVGGSNLSTSYQSRGYTIKSISIDGGSPINVGSAGAFDSNYLPTFDLSAYDSVAVVRGSAGQYSGIGDPAGVLSLQRKRPLNEVGASIDQSFGSYNSKRTQMDFNTGQLFEGLLKIRSSFVYDDADFFYRYASKSVKQAYINAELTPAEGTVINFGTTINETVGTPWFGGLPTFRNGVKPLFARDTCLCAPWSTARIEGREYFVRATQDIVDDWKLIINTSANFQKVKSDFLFYNAFASSGMNNDGTGAYLSELRNKTISDQYKADAFINGKGELFGMMIEPTFGFSYSYIDQSYTNKPLSYLYPRTLSLRTSAFDFDTSAFQQIPTSSMFAANSYKPSYSQQQLAGYVNLRISPTPWLHVNVGERISSYNVNNENFSNGKTTQTQLKTLNVPIPDVGVTIDLDPAISIYGSYATIYNPSLLFSEPGNLASPMTGQTWEAGIKRSDLDGLLTSSVALYNTVLLNYPVFNPNNPNSSINTGDYNSNCCYIADGTTQVSNGIDAELTGQITPNWNLTLSYNYNDSKTSYGPLSAQQNNIPISRLFPKHVAKGFTVFRPYIGIPEIDQALAPVRIGLGAEYRSARFYTSNNFVPGAGYINSTITGGEFVTFSAMIKYIISDKAYAQLNLTNLTDRKFYSQIGSIYGGNWYGQPFTAIGSVHYHF